MGDDNFLIRRVKLNSTAYPANNLNSNHIRQESIMKGFVSQASDPSMLAAVIMGGALSKGIQGFGYSKFLPLAQDSRLLFPLLKKGIDTAAVVGEAGAFVTTDRVLKVGFSGADPALLHWQGEQGLENAWKSAFVNFGAFRIIQPFTAQHNFIFRHASNSSTIVAANQVTGLLGLSPKPHEELTFQFIDASVLDLQMQSGMQLLHGISPRTNRPRVEDLIGWQKNTFDLSASKANPELSLEMLQPRLAARGEKAISDKLIVSELGTAPRWHEMLGIKVRFYLRLLLPKLPLAKDLIHLLKNNALDQRGQQFAFDALLRIAMEAPFPRRKQILSELKKSFYEAQSAPDFLKWMHILEVYLPHFHQTDLMEIGEHFRTKPLQSILSGKTIGEFITLIAYEITNRKSQMQESAVSDIETAHWLGQFISHEKASVGNTAARNCLLLLESLPPAEAKQWVDKYKTNFSEETSNLFYWIQHADQQLRSGQPLSEIAKTWYQQRNEAAFQQLKRNLASLYFPRDWSELTLQKNRIQNITELIAFQNALREKFLTSDSAKQNVAEQVWQNMTPSSRWTLLEVMVGPDQYISLTGAQALHLRKLATEGQLAKETAIGTPRRSITPTDEVLFILGNNHSVGVPEAFVDQKGGEEASRYLMIHHTHPYSFETRNIREIYPSTHYEGAESGDLYALSKQFNSLKEGEEIALSVTQTRGGSIYILRNIKGRAIVDIYTGIRQMPGRESRTIQDPELKDVRKNIRNWAESKGIDIHFFEVPYHQIELMEVPRYGMRNNQVREVIDP